MVVEELLGLHRRGSGLSNKLSAVEALSLLPSLYRGRKWRWHNALARFRCHTSARLLAYRHPVASDSRPTGSQAFLVAGFPIKEGITAIFHGCQHVKGACISNHPGRPEPGNRAFDEQWLVYALKERFNGG